MRINVEYLKDAWKKSIEFFKLVGRRIRLIRLNKNSLVFLIFLAISISFWFMQSLKETSTISQEYTLKVVGIPRSVIFTSDIPDKIRVNITGRGYNLVNYIWKYEEHVVTINYDDLEHTLSKVTFNNSLLRRSVTKTLDNGLIVSSLSPAQVEVYYTKGMPKRVPIKFVGNPEAGLQHVLCGIQLLKDSALVYAPRDLHDSIDVVRTEKLDLKDIEDTTTVRIALKKIEGARIVPDSVDVRFCVDLFAEKTLSVPIYSENCPRNKTLRTFPGKADITFRISTTMYNEVDADDFLLTIDFNKLKQNDNRCKVELKDKPEGVSHVRWKPEYVEFVIEQE